MSMQGLPTKIYTRPLMQLSVADRTSLADAGLLRNTMIAEDDVCYSKVQEVVSMNFEKVSDNIRHQNTFLDLLYLIHPLSLPQYDTAFIPFTF